MAWYDIFSNFYDAFLGRLYHVHRQRSVDALQLKPGMCVVDAPCGTGASFPYLAPSLGSEGTLVGIDLSKGMLRKAKRREGLGCRLQTVHDSLTELRSDDVPAEGSVDRILIFLGLTTIEDYAQAVDRLWALLKPGGRMVVVDTHAEKPGLAGLIVNLVARADIRRRVWEPLEQRASSFELQRFDADWRIGGDIIQAVGIKQATGTK